MVYLLHFDKPIGHIQHWAGQTSDVPLMRALAAGDASPLQVPIVVAARDAGVGVTVARVWTEVYRTVHELPYANARTKLCPTCLALQRDRRRR